ncbi:tyrosine-type recombinase/integrase [Victivallis sp. Marseille-Q1083]|uniref:tyrosine-type recombinase/integrase n=1 Tax=Victivallis sp. Marseille-Q1083 TaxID=2717288 RepID=UPI0020CA2EC6|nr:tyrosine-type recombinase/integrase [Victivallis sp. Marseille-Q1083]
MPSGFYAVQYYDDDGKRRQKTLLDRAGNPTKIKEEAEQLIRQRFATNTALEQLESKEEAILKLMETRQMMVKCSLTLTEAWNKFHEFKEGTVEAITLKGYESAWRTFIGYMSKRHPIIEKIGEVTQSVLEDYFNFRKAQKVSAQTFRVDTITLKSVWRKALGPETEKLFLDLPKIPKSQQSREPLTLQELQHIFSLLSSDSLYELNDKDEYRCLLKLMAFTGIRGGEGTQMTWQDINESFTEISFVPNKTKRSSPDPVTIPIHRELRAELLYRFSIRASGDVYIMPKLQMRYRSYTGAISKIITKILQSAGIITSVAPNAQVRRAIRKTIDPQTQKVVAKQCKICRKSMHSVRHYFATIASKLSIDPLITQRILGHKTLKMTSHYTHIDIEQKSEAIARLPDIYPADTIDVVAVDVTANTRQDLLSEITLALHDLPLNHLMLIRDQLRLVSHHNHELPLNIPLPAVTEKRLNEVLFFNNIEVGKIFGISDSMVTRYLKKYDLPTSLNVA